ncbi:site-specific integrase [Ruania alkalisoli]|uniref:Site-specific integrase n=1 Tax=Ruania alkalisoli TaxID=2779775 RepID=A0A7M1SWU2_9MICO|nr:site-specific integrase [Ruania alkalisoli]QOR71961.1 site-specific integrase [Ruania alkalisoli]
MARAATPVGEIGKITATHQVHRDGAWRNLTGDERPSKGEKHRWRARARYRESINAYRAMERYADTKAKAERQLRDAVRDQSEHAARTQGRADQPLGDAAAAWRSQMEQRKDLSDKSKRVYRDACTRFIESNSEVNRLALVEVDLVEVTRFLMHVAERHGSGSAKTARSVLSGVLEEAVQAGALPMNVARGARIPKMKRDVDADGVSEDRAMLLESLGVPRREWTRDTDRAMTREQRDQVCAFVTYDEMARTRDVADLVQFLAGTGVRINEALALRWQDVDLTADSGTAFIRGTKTERSQRLLHLPTWLVDVLRQRQAERGSRGYVFGSPHKGDLHRRDGSAVDKALRSILDRAGYPWATAHTFRRTVATLLVDAGLSVADAADQLGHEDTSMTMREYLGRGRGRRDVADAL